MSRIVRLRTGMAAFARCRGDRIGIWWLNYARALTQLVAAEAGLIPAARTGGLRATRRDRAA